LKAKREKGRSKGLDPAKQVGMATPKPSRTPYSHSDPRPTAHSTFSILVTTGEKAVLKAKSTGEVAV